ncbi:MAG: aspartyl/glutamyl-tRNA amidotransferase subunit C, partial [Actinobacteria bacterium]|nr:aspartyl/glutamyl-tRNA amidotransferase subunit C [Actinomycetota bacterium]
MRSASSSAPTRCDTATLARLGLDDAEVERLAGELETILGHVATISALPIADVPPTAHSLDVAGALREDVAKPGVTREQARRSKQGYYA